MYASVYVHCGNGLSFICKDSRSAQVSPELWPYLVVDSLKTERLVTFDLGILFCFFAKQTSLHLFPTNTSPILMGIKYIHV